MVRLDSLYPISTLLLCKKKALSGTNTDIDNHNPFAETTKIPNKKILTFQVHHHLQDPHPDSQFQQIVLVVGPKQTQNTDSKLDLLNL